MAMTIFTEGLEQINDQLQRAANAAKNGAEAVRPAAEAFVADVHALPRPRGQMGAGHTHMLDSVAGKPEGKGYLVGWGQYYGRFVEHGTSKMGAQPHLIPTWEKNEDKYMQLIQEQLTGGI